VAEHVPEGCDMRDDEIEDDPERITPLGDYIRGRRQRTQQSSSQSSPRKEIVGYVLGKVEERPVYPRRQIFPPSRVDTVPYYEDEETLMKYLNNGNSNNRAVRFPSRRPQPVVEKEKIGHITSLAVHSHARRLGIASSLLHQLHFHLRECHGADSVGLHVRISNTAAVRLYCEDGYDVADIIPMYYGDGEDAYFMRKDISTVVSEAIPQQPEEEPQNQQRRWRRGEKERNEWLNRDATRSGSFFDGRKSMRDTLSEEERAWVNDNQKNSSNGNRISASVAATNRNIKFPSRAPSLSGQFKQSFQTFFNGGELLQQQRQRNQSTSPPWDVGPEGLRLPRYSSVARAPPPPLEATERRMRGTMSLKDLVTGPGEEEGRDDSIIKRRFGNEEEDDVLTLDARVASGSV